MSYKYVVRKNKNISHFSFSTVPKGNVTCDVCDLPSEFLANQLELGVLDSPILDNVHERTRLQTNQS